MTRIVAAGFLSLFLTACGVESENSTQTSSEKFSYSFNDNGCETDKHSFTSLDALCDGLEDNDLNNNCALTLRQQYFEQRCDGNFNPS